MVLSEINVFFFSFVGLADASSGTRKFKLRVCALRDTSKGSLNIETSVTLRTVSQHQTSNMSQCSVCQCPNKTY